MRKELVKIHLFPLWVWGRYRWIVSKFSYGYLFIVKRKNKPVRKNKEQLLLFWDILWSGNEVLWHTTSIFCTPFPTLRSFPRFSPTSTDWNDLACMHALEKEMETHSNILAWRSPGTEETGALLSMGSHRVGRDWSSNSSNTYSQEPTFKFGEILWTSWPDWQSEIGRWECAAFSPWKSAKIIILSSLPPLLIHVNCRKTETTSLFFRTSLWYLV